MVTAIGFVGFDDIAHDTFLDPGEVELGSNLLLLLLLIAVIYELAWRQGDRAHEHQRAIVVLTDFIRDLENRLRQPIAADDDATVAAFGDRHELIIEILPAHTDADYLAAKKAAADKARKKVAINA